MIKDVRGVLAGRIKQPCAALYIASHIHPSHCASPHLYLSYFKAARRENMSETGGIILGGQLFRLRHAQQIDAIRRPRLNDS